VLCCLSVAATNRFLTTRLWKNAGGTFNSAKEITKRVKQMEETGGKWGRRVKKVKSDASEYGAVGAQGWLLG